MPQQNPGPGGRSAARTVAAQNQARDDDELMARVSDGDSSAFELLVDRHLEKILALGRRMLGQDHAAEDVAQEALVRLWRQAGKWEPGRARVSTWLHRVTANLCIDQLRSPETARRVALENAPEQIQPARQQQRLEERELKDKIDGALQSLPDRQRLALVLFHYQGLSMKETAAVLETSGDAVESLLGRARRQLKSTLKSEWRKLLPDKEL